MEIVTYQEVKKFFQRFERIKRPGTIIHGKTPVKVDVAIFTIPWVGKAKYRKYELFDRLDLNKVRPILLYYKYKEKDIVLLDEVFAGARRECKAHIRRDLRKASGIDNLSIHYMQYPKAWSGFDHPRRGRPLHSRIHVSFIVKKGVTLEGIKAANIHLNGWSEMIDGEVSTLNHVVTRPDSIEEGWKIFKEYGSKLTDTSEQTYLQVKSRDVYMGVKGSTEYIFYPVESTGKILKRPLSSIDGLKGEFIELSKILW